MSTRANDKTKWATMVTRALLIPLLAAHCGAGRVMNNSLTGSCASETPGGCVGSPSAAVMWEGVDNGLMVGATVKAVGKGDELTSSHNQAQATHRWPAACDLVDPDETALPQRVYTPPLPIGPADASKARGHV